MSNSSTISLEESQQHGYREFLSTLMVLACPPEEQCELTGDGNTAWDLRDDALTARYLIGSGLFTVQQETAIHEFLAAIDPVPVNDMPTGSGRTKNLTAMQHPAWVPIRILAKQLIVSLEPVTQANMAYFKNFANAP
jgi:hypothetical protein